MFDVKFIAATAAAVLALASPQAARSQGSEPPATGPTPQNPTGQPPGQPGTPGQPGATTPAPTPPAPTPAPSASQPGAATAPQPGAPIPLSEGQKKELGSVWNHNQLQVGLGDLAGSRGSSEEVKNLGRWIAGEQKKFGAQLMSSLKDRGIADPGSLPMPSDAQGIQQDLQQLGQRSGEDFDRAFMTFLKTRGTGFVEALKRARDATPGKDSSLKKLLDQAEDQAEAHLTAARQLDARRAQARTPPKR